MEHARDAERIDSPFDRDEDRSIGTHRKARAQLLLGIGVADRNGDHLAGVAGLADAQGFLESDLVKRIDAHLDAIGLYTTAVTPDLNSNVVVNDTFQANNDLVHCMLPGFNVRSGRRPASSLLSETAIRCTRAGVSPLAGAVRNGGQSHTHSRGSARGPYR